MNKLLGIAIAIVVAGVASTTDAQYRQQVLADMPAVYWKLDEPSGTTAANDVASTYSGADGGGTYVNSPSLGQASAIEPWGVSGEKSATFSGAQYVYSNSTVEGRDYWYASNSFTIEAWIRFTAEGVERDLITKDGIWTIGQNFDDDLVFSAAAYSGSCDPSVGTAIGIDDTKWHHVAWAYDADADTFSGFKDGVRKFFKDPCDFSITSALANVYVSNGKFDEIAFYKWALPNDRIKAHFMSRKPCVAPAGRFDPQCEPQIGQSIVYDTGGNGWLNGPVIRTAWFNAGIIDVDGTQCTREEYVIGGQPDAKAVVQCTEGGTETLSVSMPLPPDYAGGPVRPRSFGQSLNATPSGTLTMTTHACCRSPGEFDDVCLSSNTDRPDLSFVGIVQFGPVNGVGHTIDASPACADDDWLTLEAYIGRSGGTMSDMLVRSFGFDYRSNLRGGIR